MKEHIVGNYRVVKQKPFDSYSKKYPFYDVKDEQGKTVATFDGYNHSRPFATAKEWAIREQKYA